MPGHEPDSTSSPNSDFDHTGHISAETMERCARLLAAGEMDWPEGLSAEQDAELLAAVRRFRRARLVRLIASRIAADIACEARSKATEPRS
jgi:hypothetical protein